MSKFFSNKPKTLFTRRGFLRSVTTLAATVSGAASTHRHVRAQSPNERIGVAVIGCGSRGNGHLQALDWLRTNEHSVEIVAVCDIYRPRLMKTAEMYGVKAFMDHRELLSEPGVDAVFIATPDHHHGYQTLDAIRAGKDVFCEKPMTHWRQFPLAKEVAKVVGNSDRVFQLGTQGMSDSAWHQMRELVKSGLIGQPIHAECGYFRVGDWGERGMPIDDPNAQPGPDLNWEAFLGDAPKRPFDVSRFFRWRMYEDYAGGPVTDLFPHTLTPVVHALDAQIPEIVVATGGKFRYEEREVPDTFNLLADYPERFNITVMGTQGNDFPNTGRRGSNERTPVIRGWDGTLYVEGKEIVFAPNHSTEKKEARFPTERDEDMIHFFRHFISCCRNRDKNTFSPVDLAFRTQTALIMGMLAYRERKAARFDREKQEILFT